MLLTSRILKTSGRIAAAVLVAGSFAWTTPAVAGDDVKIWQKKIVKRIATKQVYPRSAINREIEGSAKVRVSVDRSGAVTAYEMVEATGHKVLDNEVPKLMKRIDPLPAPPEAVPDERLTFVLPLAWILQ